MTGFASVSGTGFTLTVKSVNHRFLDLQVRTPAAYDGLESVLRGVVRATVKRGHVELSLQVDSAVAGIVEVRRNDALLGALVSAYREAASLHGLAGEPDLGTLMRSPGVVTTEAGFGRVVLDAAEVAASAEELMVRFGEARELEGTALTTALRESVGRLLGLTDEMAELRAGVREAHLARLRERLTELLEGLDVAVSEERLMTEAALLAERSDVEEEVVRMGTHARQFLAILDEGGEVGKKLDFLLQEMNREANTMVSKMNGAMGERGLRLTAIGLAMKSEIEKCKEQVQNLE